MSLTVVFWHWWAFGALLLAVELLAPGVFFLWIAEAAVVTGGLLWLFPGLEWEWQLVIFSVLSVVSVAVARKVIVRHPIVSDRPSLNQRTRQYFGRTFVLSESIDNGEGKLRVDDSTWKIRGKDLPAGSRVRVIGADGVVLQVEGVGTEPVSGRASADADDTASG